MKGDAGIDGGGGSADAPPAGYPINATTAGTVDENGTLDLMGNLVTADMDNTAAQLTYTIRSLPADGSIRLDGTPLAVGATFTQQDVDENKVSYVHDGAENASDGFAWDLSDGEHQIPASGTIDFAITVTNVNDAPILVNNPITTIAEGNSEVLTTTRLMVTDAEGSPLTYTLTAQTHGNVQTKVGGTFTDLAINGTFTQQDIVNGDVRFADSGVDDANLVAQTNTTASFSWRVEDPDGGVDPVVGANVTSFTITPVDDAPSVTWDPDDCIRSTAPGFDYSANPLSAISDVDTPIAEYQICIVAFVIGNCVGSQAYQCVVSLTNTLGATMGINSCVEASTSNFLVRATLPDPVPTGGSAPGVTWRLMRNNVQVGGTHTVSHPYSQTCTNT